VKILSHQYPNGPEAPEGFELPVAGEKEKTKNGSESSSHTYPSKTLPPPPTRTSRSESSQSSAFSGKDIEKLFKFKDKFLNGKEVETSKMLFDLVCLCA